MSFLRQKYLIYFQVTSSDKILLVGRLGYVPENMIDCIGNNAAEFRIVFDALHRKGFAGTRLSIGKDGPVEPVKYLNTSISINRNLFTLLPPFTFEG